MAAEIERLCTDRRPGLYHAANQGTLSRYEFAREIMAAAGHDPDRVEPIVTAALQPPRPAVRPANSALENRALALAGLEQPSHFREPLRRLVDEIRG